MAHDSHHGHSTDGKIKTSFSSSFWLIVILVGLFVAALNFIQAETEGPEWDHGATRQILKTDAGHTGAKAVESPEAAAHEGTNASGSTMEDVHHEATDSAKPAEKAEH